MFIKQKKEWYIFIVKSGAPASSHELRSGMKVRESLRGETWALEEVATGKKGGCFAQRRVAALQIIGQPMLSCEVKRHCHIGHEAMKGFSGTMSENFLVLILLRMRICGGLTHLLTLSCTWPSPPLSSLPLSVHHPPLPHPLLSGWRWINPCIGSKVWTLILTKHSVNDKRASLNKGLMHLNPKSA